MNKHAILRFSSAAVLALPVLQGCGGGGGSTSVSDSDSGLSSIPTPAPGATTLADCYGNDVLYATGTTYETDEK